MRTVKNTTTNVNIVEKSEFIAILLSLSDESQLKGELENLKKTYPKARHYCYAAKIKEFSKSSDDGEPKGTAGRPMLELINKNQLDMVALIVIRYFGGVKLGASRLLRTYVESAALVIEKSEMYEIIEVNRYQVILSYGDYEYLNSKLGELGAEIEVVKFDIKVSVTLWSQGEIYEKISNYLSGNSEIMALNKREHYVKVEEKI